MSSEPSSPKQLELNKLIPPKKLFKDIDGLLKRFHAVKRTYTKEWNKFKFLQSQRESIAVSDHEIETYINKIKRLQFSFHKWLSDLCNIASTIDSESNIESLIASKKDKPEPKQSRSRSLGLTVYSSPQPMKLVVPYEHQQMAVMTLNNTIKLDVPSDQPQSVMKLNNTIKLDVPRDQEDEDDEDEPELSVMEYSMDRRGTTVRSFGAMFSKEFKMGIAQRYRKSVAYSIDEKTSDDNASTPQMKVVQYFHDNYYGQNEVFESAFGLRPVIYCDWTASGKLLECVETYLQKEMYTLYANTHTTTSITGIQTSKFRSEARSIICESLGGDHDQDIVIFTGSGVTGAINKMSRILMGSVGKAYKPQTTLVFISIYEHNSNIFIWKELGIKVIVIPEDCKKGGLDLIYLESKLKEYRSSHLIHKYNLLIGSFTAASNVSGIIAPIFEATALLHKYGALSFWDYATAGPYLDVNMTNKEDPTVSKDAVFISTHKYLGGPGAPGILCAKKALFENYVPVIPGGGTVFAAFGIEDGEWQYLDNIEEREEGGTPDIIGSVRAAFVFMVKDHLSTRFIEETENKYLKYFYSETKSLDNLVMMGNTECDRLPVLSFLITHTQKCSFGSSKTKYLHHNFIAALFNDLFGIQGRGGCACAGMYGLTTLGLDSNEVNCVLEQMRDEKNELARPGYFRINLHYTLNEKEVKYIVNAVKYICQHGWQFLTLYDVDKRSGNYFHRDIKRKPHLLKKQLRSLLDISFDESDGAMKWKKKHMRVKGNELNDNLDKFFDLANGFLNKLDEYQPSKDEFVNEDKINDDNAWYWLPSELYQDID